MKYAVKLLGIALIALLSGCVMDAGPDDGNNPSDESAKITFRLDARTMSQTRAANTTLENDIQNISIFIFRRNSGDGVFYYEKAVAVENFTVRDGGGLSFVLEASESTTPVKYCALVNLNDIDYNSTVTGAFDTAFNGQSYEYVFHTVMHQAIKNVMGDPISKFPMSGEGTLSVVAGGQTYSLTIPLLRVVARVDLALDLDEGSDTFVPAEVRVYGMSTNFYWMCDEDAWGDASKTWVDAPVAWISDFPAYTSPFAVDVYTDGTGGKFATAYLSEHLAAQTHDERLNSTSIVVGGYYDGSGTKTYYRVNIAPDPTTYPGHGFGQILRNWQYNITITDVTGPGRTTPDEAATADNTAIQATVEPWTVKSGDYNLIGGNDYVAITNRTPVLKSRKGSMDTVTVTSNVPIALYTGSQTPSNSFTVKQTENSFEDGVYTLSFSIATNQDYLDGSSPAPSGYFSILANNLYVVPGNITFTQAPPTVQPDKTVRIYSAGSSEGSLGDAAGNEVGAGSLRNLLSMPGMFGPTGYIKIREFTFDNDPTGTLFTVEANAAELADVLSNVDILVLPYGINPGAANSTAILNWLDKPTSVLFVSCEQAGTVGSLVIPATNVTFRQMLYTKLGYTMSWSNFGLIADLLGGSPQGIQPAAMPAGGNPFFAGPLGNTTSYLSATFYTGDTLTGFTGYTGTGFVPLLYTYRSDIGLGIAPSRHTGEILLGVDVPHRVVYVGESQLFDLPFLNINAAPGQAGVPTVLIGNLWAWAGSTAATE